jgi:hypothetical protein
VIRPIVVLLAAVTIGFVWEPSRAAPPSEGHGRLCFNREEQNGYLNVVPVRIKIVDGDEAAIGTDETVCFDLLAYSYRMRLEWKWDERNRSARAYHSAQVSLKLKQGRTETFQICPAASPSQGYDLPWWNLTRACPWPR